MRIQLKILNKKFYSEESDGTLLNPLPSYSTQGSAALDLVCTDDITLYPGERKVIKTGLAIWIGGNGHTVNLEKADRFGPCGGERLALAGIIIPRSGLGTKGLILANSVGLIDEDYQGELLVSVLNSRKITEHNDNNEELWNMPISLKAGDRFAQLMIIPVIKAQFDVVDDFSYNTERGEGGFGSTDV